MRTIRDGFNAVKHHESSASRRGEPTQGVFGFAVLVFLAAVVFDAAVFFAAVDLLAVDFAVVVFFAAVVFAAVVFAGAVFLAVELDAFVVFADPFDAVAVLDPPVEVVAVPSDFSVTVVDSLSTLGTCSPFASVETSPCIRTVLRPKSSGPRAVRGERRVRPSCNDWVNA